MKVLRSELEAETVSKCELEKELDSKNGQVQNASDELQSKESEINALKNFIDQLQKSIIEKQSDFDSEPEDALRK